MAQSTMELVEETARACIELYQKFDQSGTERDVLAAEEDIARQHLDAAIQERDRADMEFCMARVALYEVEQCRLSVLARFSASAPSTPNFTDITTAVQSGDAAQAVETALAVARMIKEWQKRHDQIASELSAANEALRNAENSRDQARDRRKEAVRVAGAAKVAHASVHDKLLATNGVWHETRRGYEAMMQRLGRLAGQAVAAEDAQSLSCDS